MNVNFEAVRAVATSIAEKAPGVTKGVVSDSHQFMGVSRGKAIAGGLTFGVIATVLSGIFLPSNGIEGTVQFAGAAALGGAAVMTRSNPNHALGWGIAAGVLALGSVHGAVTGK